MNLKILHIASYTFALAAQSHSSRSCGMLGANVYDVTYPLKSLVQSIDYISLRFSRSIAKSSSTFLHSPLASLPNNTGFNASSPEPSANGTRER